MAAGMLIVRYSLQHRNDIPRGDPTIDEAPVVVVGSANLHRLMKDVAIAGVDASSYGLPSSERSDTNAKPDCGASPAGSAARRGFWRGFGGRDRASRDAASRVSKLVMSHGFQHFATLALSPFRQRRSEPR